MNKNLFIFLSGFMHEGNQMQNISRLYSGYYLLSMFFHNRVRNIRL
jgi:hypothetical protein